MRFKRGAVWTISRFLQVDTSGAFADFATRNNEDIFTILSVDTSGRSFDFKRGEARTFWQKDSTEQHRPFTLFYDGGGQLFENAWQLALMGV